MSTLTALLPSALCHRGGRHTPRPYKYCAVVSLGFRARAQGYIMKAMQAGLLKDIDQRDIVVNIMNSADYCAGFASTAPTLMRKSHLFSLALRRGMLPLEHMAVMGVPLFLNGRAEISQTSPLRFDVLTSLSDGQVRHLAGNGMALSAIGCVLLLALCSLPAAD